MAYQVEEDNPVLDGSYNRYDGIEIRRQPRNPDQEAETLLHEALHAVWEVNAFPGRMGEEATVECLCGPLLDFLNDNRELISGIWALYDRGVPLRFPEAAS